MTAPTLDSPSRPTTHSSFFRFVTAMALGSLITVAARWFADTKRPALDGMPHLTPVQIGNVVPSEKWINNYDVFIAPLENVRTSSNYAILIVVPKGGVSGTSLSTALAMRQRSLDGRPLFELTGLAGDGGVKPVMIDARFLSQNLNVPVVSILDYIDTSISIQGGGPVVLQSRSNPIRSK